MFEKTVFIRFDIDTITCMERGVPRLLQLAKELGIKITFFVNYGKSIDHSEILLKTFGRTLKNVAGNRKKISILRKLGCKDTMRTFLLNPCIGESHDDYVSMILNDGHEVGLHGGHNHSIWQRNAHVATKDEIENWLVCVHEKFSKRHGQPVGFASPGGNGSTHAYTLLKLLGYCYVSDDMTGANCFPYFEKNGLLQIPVNGQIDQIPLLEYFRARGFPEDKIVEETVEHLKECTVKTLVAHPVWEGYRDIDLFRKAAIKLLHEGYEFACFKHLYDYLAQSSLEGAG